MVLLKEATTTVENDFNWKLTLEGDLNLLDANIIEKLKSYNYTIYFNDIDWYYWMMDFEINDVWFSTNKSIDIVKRTMTLEVYN
jgi:hypothetical protein